MDEANARATLVDLADDGAPRALATIPRREVEEALRSEDGPPDLILDIARYEGEGDSRVTTAGTVSVSWSREDLEGLLRRAEGDSVTLAFDAEGLEQALATDVEAHGIREAAAVLAVAVAAGSAAGTAAAQQAEGVGGVGGSTAIEQVRTEAGGTPPGAAIEAARAAEAATPADYGMARAMPSDYAAVPTTGSTEYGMPRAMPADFPATTGADIEAVRVAAAAEQAAEASTASGEYGMPRAMPADLPATGPGADIEAVRVAAAAEQAAEASTVSNIEAVRSAEIAATASVPEGIGIESARSAAAEAVRTAADDSGITVSVPSPETIGALAGGVALLITGAAFALRRREHMRPA